MVREHKGPGDPRGSRGSGGAGRGIGRDAGSSVTARIAYEIALAARN